MIADLRFALRQLAKAPAFTAVAVCTLALGIGACTAMFGVINAVLLKPLPFRDPDRLVWIENVYGPGLSGLTSRVKAFQGWRDQGKGFESMGAYFAFSDYFRLTMTGNGSPERLRVMAVSDGFLPTLGVGLRYGRNFNAAECTANGPPVAILTHAYWKRRFDGDPAVVGRSVTLNNRPTTIVGVLPPSFDFSSVFTPGSPVECLQPFPLTDSTDAYGNTVFGIGRLRPGVTVAQAAAEVKLICQRLSHTTMPNSGVDAAVSSLSDHVRGPFRTPFYILTGAVACLLAIACVNLSNLLLARANSRRPEFAVRIALGARRGHLLQQALTESLLLAAGGSVLGVVLAVWATAGLARLQTFGVPLLQTASVDLQALAVTVGLTTLAGIACGVLPALHVSRGQAHGTAQNATHQRTAGRSAAAARNALVVAELALACMLLVGAGLLFRSFSALLQVNLGFQPQHAIAWRIDAGRSFKTLAEANAYVDGALQRVAKLPGVEAVGVSDTLPLGRNRTWGIAAQGVTYPPGEFHGVFPRIVDQSYLQAMGIPLRLGRLFDDRDTAQSERTVVINEHLAHDLWPGRDPVGQKITQDGGTTVIGVVGDVRHGSLEAAGDNEMYLNFRQSGDWTAVDMVVRSERPAAALVPEVRAALAAYDPNLPTGEFHELESLVDNAVAPRRLITRMLGLFSTLAVALAAIGLYGVIAYSVTQRTQEIGIRLAIGAQRRDVLELILKGGLSLAAVGLALGLAGSLALTQLLRGLLYGVSARDPMVFVADAALLLGIAVVACLLPAWRATRIEPVQALRSE